MNVNATRNAQAMTLVAAFLGWMFDGMEMGIFPLIARPALLEMQQAQGIPDEGFVQRWMGILTAAFLFGAAGGGLVFGWLGDRIGRVRAMTLSILCYSIFTGLGYFVTAPWQLATLRFIAALGMGGEWSLGVALVMEAWPAKLRPLMAGIIGAAANVGFLVIGIIGIIWPISQGNWRWVLIVGALPALLTFLIRIFVPESEKWKRAVANDVVRPLQEVFSPALLKKTLLSIGIASVPIFVTWGIVQWIPLWADQMAGQEQPRAKAYTGIVLAVGAIIGCLIAPLVGQKIGRRRVYFALCLVSLISCVFLFRTYHVYSSGFLFAAGLVGMFTASFFGWLPQYLPELFPTRVRATGQGLAFNLARILAGVGALNMGTVLGWFDKSYAQAGVAIAMVYVIGMIVIWFAPETKGKPLPE